MKKAGKFVYIAGFFIIVCAVGFALNYYGVFDSGGIAPFGGSNDTVTVSLDEWHGWKPVVDANHGLGQSKQGSPYHNMGLNVDIRVINDDEEALQAFIAGDVVAIGLSVNEWAYVHARLRQENVSGRMVMMTDRSTGGDGIVTTADITSIEGLYGHRIAVSKNSAAHVMLEWLLKTSGLTAAQTDEIKRDMVYTNSTEETFEALVSGQAEAAALWEPYITLAERQANAKILFSTKSASNLMIDGIVFREDYLNKYPDKAADFIKGALSSIRRYESNYEYIRQFEDYSGLSNAEIRAMSDLVSFANFADNVDLFDGTVQILYREMAEIWMSLGEATLPNGEDTAFDSSFLLRLQSDFANDSLTTDNYNQNGGQINTDTDTLLRRTLTINFSPNVAVITEDSYPALNEFANIAKILSGSIIRVEGNIADTGIGDTDTGRLLSEQRAKAVCDFLINLGIDDTRFVYAGNGISKPVPELDPRSEEGMRANRRTDIFFIRVE
ncbi:MAG: phosphate ABC transporter substrate-binding/OmpA family protein [Oscillospiraceae bacterium]|nr:phosphate ABC transporter substrate-binding/OmpA family protein [Oscillospiraceae bacterium]